MPKMSPDDAPSTNPEFKELPEVYQVFASLHLWQFSRFLAGPRDNSTSSQGLRGRLSSPMEVRSKGSGPLYQSATEAAKRAIELSQPFDMLSPSTYDKWETVEINFDPRTFSTPGPPR
jgi:hypothetical protein